MTYATATPRRIAGHTRAIARAARILPRVEDFEHCWPVLRKYFGEVRPAATMMEAKLIDPRVRIEIEVTARKENRRAE